ncbi:hypothetical protein [Aquipseudomonas alcaligenes]|uniref:Uncharacterized protein n=1 Tax=Aquipseudomonas alcaligenes TaxID=43263 RepID=A0AA37CJJ6_AQUAC|nr:hypothetical protein [Pseudomonas alcaligenes]BCR26238.1 hypothetical protein KAM426_37650 [Pseudomonas alcaligenes]GIZ68782.1 hypothetical protein KAM428_38670 [Pseudomonas alcaligenes]GIZ73166.1 hypothetical protein KAM429_39270 [Pseudomonas alcaligenes]GIZ77517.1 hypothetical protein KAM430_39260 [Pseudomonas alcaligenes]GIZ81826.1 hypothetical protein KAM432_38740 [Pseudomonas alcaligenes]
MLTALCIALAVLLVVCGLAGRMIFVLVRDREDRMQFNAALERAIHQAGWTEQYRVAYHAAHRELREND